MVIGCSVPSCKVIHERLRQLARKHRASKFLKIVSTDCIRGYPDKNLPSILVYHSGALKKQFIGTVELGGANPTEDGKLCY